MRENKNEEAKSIFNRVFIAPAGALEAKPRFGPEAGILHTICTSLTWKTLLDIRFNSYTYLTKYCDVLPKWVTFHDDDVFVDHMKLTAALRPLNPSRPKFICPFRKAISKHQSSDKFSFDKELWDPEIKYFPAYCAGPCTTISGETAQKIYSTAIATNWRGENFVLISQVFQHT